MATWPSNQVRVNIYLSKYILVLFQYWKQLAYDIGTYEEDEVNADGPRGEEIKEEIKNDYTRFDIK